MQFLKKIEDILANKYFYLLPLFVSVSAVLATPKHLLDDTHEIILAGNRWLSDNSILYVQNWSAHSPQTLFFGHIYSKFINNTFLQTLLEVAFVFAFMALAYTIFKMVFRRSLFVRSALLLMFSSLLYIPHVWQIGVSESKLAVLFFLLFLFGYYKWKQSTKSMWLFGSTSKNWRYLLLAGVALSMLVYTSFLYIPFALPVLFDFVNTTKKSKGVLIKWGSFLTIPLLLEAWLWISVLASRSLLTPHVQASIANLQLRTLTNLNLQKQLPILLVIVTLLVILLVHVDARRIRKHTLLWIGSIGLIIAGVLLPYGAIYCALPIFMLMIYAYNKRSQLVITPQIMAIIAGIVIMLSVPLHWLDARQSSLDYARAQLAIAYVEQRSMESNIITYYGKGAGIFAESGLANSTRFNDLSVLNYDTSTIAMESSFRGDAEAVTPMFVIYATDGNFRAPPTPRLEQYFTKHYEKVADLDGYQILKRR